ncbi:MAG: lipocalin/fatty-acid binding family protein [Myxococcota bacterium]
MATLLTAFLLVVSPAWAADFTGTWVLDHSASDSPEELLKAQGMSMIKRKAVAKLDVTQKVTQEGNVMTFEVVTSKKTKTNTLHVDGEVRTVEGDRGSARVRHVWEGDDLVSTSITDETTIVTRRTLSDGGRTMTQRFTLTPKDGSTISINRVFRMRD